MTQEYDIAADSKVKVPNVNNQERQGHSLLYIDDVHGLQTMTSHYVTAFIDCCRVCGWDSGDLGFSKPAPS